MSVMILHSGKLVDPFALRPEDVDPRDIAHHTSLINRYCGATPHAYSVAEHMVRGSEWIEDFCRLRIPSSLSAAAGEISAAVRYAVLCAKWFLLHDATETYLGDVHRSVKHDPRMAWYREAEERLRREVIAPRFDLPPDMPLEVEELDRAICGQEMTLLCRGRAQDVDESTLVPIPGLLLGTWTAAEAEVRWLNRLVELWGRLP